MSNIAPLIDHYLAEYARLERDLPGSDANQRARKDALKAFAEAGFPDTRQEEWKYTSLRPVEKRRFEASSEAGDVSQDALAAFLPADLDAYRIVIVDGHFDPRLSSLDGLPQGVQVQSFAQYLNDNDDARVRSDAIDAQPGSLSDMNAAFATDGAYVHVAANTAADKPIHVITLSSGGHEDRMSQVRHRYVMDRGSQATVSSSKRLVRSDVFGTSRLTSSAQRAGSGKTPIIGPLQIGPCVRPALTAGFFRKRRPYRRRP